jgi:plastocyanin
VILLPLVAAAAVSSTPVGVGESEYRLDVYRTAVRVGAVHFNVSNGGEDTHDLQVLDPAGRAIAQSPDIRAGRQYSLRAKFKRAGAYTLLCTKPGHAALGMEATLRVRPAPRRHHR